jgi:hypothetical protein
MIQGKKNLSYERCYESSAILLCDNFTAETRRRREAPKRAEALKRSKAAPDFILFPGAAVNIHLT